MDLAQYAENFIERHPRLEMLIPRQSINICFRMVPDYDIDIYRLNLDLRDKLYKTGRAMVNYAKLEDKRVVLRMMLVDADLTFADLDCFFEKIFETADSMKNKTGRPN